MKNRSQWASNVGFVLAAAGSAVGLGNIWKFPGKVGAYGTGAFLICYLLVVVLIGFPVMLAELSIGRKTQKNMVGAFRSLHPKWAFVGKLGLVTLFVIMSYYVVVGGWVMKYILQYLTGASFGAGSLAYQDYFVSFISEPVEPLLWALLFLGICIYVIVKGVTKGIERISKVLMPCLFLLLIGICIRAITLPGAMDGLKFMFEVHPEDFNGGTLVAALGQAFFSLSVGMGILVTYGSYVDKKENLIKSAGWICVLDTTVAFLAAVAIIPVVYVTLGVEGLGMGGGFAFMALPEVFASIPGGQVFGLVFFVLLFLAALTSAISILESLVAYLCEEFHLSRWKSSLYISIPMSLLSVGYSMSQVSDRGINLPWFDFQQGFVWLPMNVVMEKFTDNLMIPLGALLFCLFVGWVWKYRSAVSEIANEKETFRFANVWGFIIKYVAPIVILIILFVTIGLGEGLS